MINSRPLHLPKKLPGICRERFNIATLALSKYCVKGERRFARTTQARDDRKGLMGNIEVDMLKIMFARAANGYVAQVSLSRPTLI
jgi:hypothetical protein